MAAEMKLGSSLVKSVVKTRRAGYSRMAFMAAAVRVDCSVASCSGVGCSGTSGITKLGTTLVKSSHLYLYSAFNNTNCNKALHNIKIGKLCQ